ncbi:adenylate/guanylate cyclase [Candidatus Moduliflexus flocculans]|uniref:Adenylate/guanylate cyclase n=1 Tax=Candidatus Moduliflexus flocculans TaxID=1499966 RepID=A0A081BT56_9BACT|nr:adenylate/guanylate cyclase [Candidatus Moduliflexus flocculans]
MISIPGYTILETLHEGAICVVYRATRNSDHLPVALKTLKREAVSPPQLARLKREYEICSKLRLPDVITVHALEAYDNNLALVLEDIQAVSLASILQSRKLGLAEFLMLAARITSILGEIHRQHIMHLDVNPSNILWNPDTNQVKCIDFGIAAKFSQRSQEARNPNILEGTLAYMSPEQTGRINRSIDYRSDFYSLGVTLYEMLLGFLPFQTTDTMELVHCHLAKAPKSPHELNQHIPQPVSDIVMKLMAKAAEDRYQSASGLLADLRKCQEQLQFTGQIQYVAIGHEDVSDTLHIPQKLYGRTREIERLLQEFETARQGQSVCVLVSGYAGSGKSALAHELQKTIAQQRGYFVSGRFERFKSNVPYSGLIQAFQELIQQLLTENESALTMWREKLLAAVETSGHLMIDLIPEIEMLIGTQPKPPLLSPAESRNRLQTALQNVVNVFSTSGHPLVIFLDNLQWADYASLTMLQQLFLMSERQTLLLIGAYRDDGLNERHPVRRFIEALESRSARVLHVELAPLSLAEVTHLLADTLRDNKEDLFPLAKIVREKTGGNPLAVKEFLRSIYAEELLSFDVIKGRWEWNPEQIQGMAMTENVVEFMISKLQKLPAATQRALFCAACIGSQFDLHTLSAALEQPEAQTVGELDVAIHDGFVTPADESYQYMKFFNAVELREFALHVNYNFAHNRFQEAVLQLATPQDRGHFHLKIGRHLLHCDRHQPVEDEAFAQIVNHVNRGLDFIETEEEKIEAVQLNLLAVKHAKMSADYDTALRYIAQGGSLLGERRWETQHHLAFELAQEEAELECLSGRYDRSETLCREALQQAQTPLETIAIYRLLITQYTLQSEYQHALETGSAALRLLELPLPDGSLAVAVEREFTEIRRLLGSRKPIDLLDISLMTDSSKLAAMQILDRLLLPALHAHPLTRRFLILLMTRISLQYGHAQESAGAYALYGGLSATVSQEAAIGDEWGQLALVVSEHLQSPYKAAVSTIVSSQLLPWTHHVKETHRFEHDAYQNALHAGELHAAGLALLYRLLNLWYEGTNLEQMAAHLDECATFAQNSRNHYVKTIVDGCGLVLNNLRGLTPDRMTFATETLSEEAYLRRCDEQRHRVARCCYHIMKARALISYGLYQEAFGTLNAVPDAQESLPGLLLQAEYAVYAALCLLARAAEKKNAAMSIKAEFHAFQEQVERWTSGCPENFQHFAFLLQAEYARLMNQPYVAMQRYRDAIEAARKYEFIHHKGLIHKFAANCYLNAGFREFAELHAREAYYDAVWWGATRCVTELVRQYPEFLSNFVKNAPGSGLRNVAPTSTSIRLDRNADGLSVLDLSAVMKASQTLSGEIVLSNLLKEMMRIVIENAGAQKGWLILKRGDDWVIEAEGTIERDEAVVLQSLPIGAVGGMQYCPVPCTLIHYVIRSGESLVLENAMLEGKFTYDPHIVKYQVKSVLCAPLLKHGELNGVLYLENNLTSGAFTEDRLKVINMLSAQMVVSLENATLYKQLNDALENQVKLANDQVELTNAYSRFVPREFLSLLGKKSIVDVQLGEQLEKEITVMFSDIRGFTELSEQMTPQENFNFINSYLHHMSPVIREYHGFIDKYIGDAIMALFPTNADDAVTASIAMLEKLSLYNQGRKRAGYRSIQIGIGLNTGVLMLGTVGDQQRMDGTVISDAVNLASRIESMTKTYGVALLISETTYFQLQNPSNYAIRIIDQVQAKGKSEPVTVFEVFNADPPNIIDAKLKTMVLFRQGFKLYHRTKFAEAQAMFTEVLEADTESKQKHIAEAKDLFEEILHVNPHDKVARIYLERCEQILKYGVLDEWAGVWAWVNSLKNRG